MILTDSQQWVELYEGIKKETRKSEEKHVNIYVSAADADSVCALRILETMLQNDMVPHGWTAVSRYSEVSDDFLATYDEEDPVTRFVILINCGASEDIYEVLNLTQRNVTIVIIDSHRPIMHLANDNNMSSQVYVLLDSTAEGIATADIPPAADGDDSGDDSDSERENDEDNTPARRRRRVEGGGSVPGEGEPSSPGTTRRQDRKAAEDARMAYYAHGVHYGKPSACVLYDLCYYLQQNSAYLLWLALVGLTDHMVHGRLEAGGDSAHNYEHYYDYYASHVAAAGHLDEAPEMPGVDGETGTARPAPQCKIVPLEDFRFGLVRQWSLWDSMVHSPYVAARLQTYTEKGRHRLEYLMIKLGIPLKEARSSFELGMKPRFHSRLVEHLETHGVAYNLGDAIFRSFQLLDGFSRTVMAKDVVHAATALLESGALRRQHGDGDPANAPGDHRDRFWRCWNALSWTDDAGELRRGIELAKKVQKALVADGGSVVVQRLYHNFRAFRIFDLSDHSMDHRELLAHPMAMQRLAAFFQEQHLHQSQNNRRKPVVLIGPRDPPSGRCLVVGFQVKEPGKGEGNRLGEAFAAAAEEVNAQAWHDIFDTTVMEIAREDVERFKAELLRVATDLL